MRPDRIGRYEVERTLGVGGMGAVYLARDEALQRQVAIKGLLGRDTSPERRERLRREALATAALSHPAIAHVYEIVTQDDRDWLVMEYVEGSTLADLVEAGPISPAEVARIGAAVAGALAAAHAQGIVHRDVKPDNVIRTRHGDIRVLDFGLAQRTAADASAAERLTGDGMVVGTAKSMSPEQALGKPTDHRSDLFSLGSMLFELASGQAPFSGPGPMDIMVKVARNEHPALRRVAPRLPGALVAVIDRCMATDPADRFPDAEAVAVALESLAEPTGATRAVAFPSGLTRVLAPLRRRWWLGAAAALALTALALLALARGWLSPTPPLTVAVLPVQVDGDADALRLAAAAVADAVASHLSRLDGLIVVSGRDVRSAMAEGSDPVRLARDLGVRELVAARLTPSENGTRLHVDLARHDGRTGQPTWSDRLELATTDLLLLEDRVASALGDGYEGYTLEGDSATHDVAAEALELYLRAAAALSAGTPSRGYVDELAQLERAVAVSPGFVRAATSLASIHRYLFQVTSDRAHLDAAQAALDRAERAAPDDPVVRLQQIELANAVGRSEEAVSAARGLVAQRPGNEAAWRALADSLKATGDLAGAEKAFARAYALHPGWYALRGLGDVRMLRGDYRGGESALTELLSRSPRNVPGLRKLGELKMNAGSFRECEGIYRRVIEITSSVGDHVNLGNCLYFQGRFADAAERYREAASGSPQDPLPVANLADALLALGEPAAAREQYAAALERCERMLQGPSRRWGLLRIRARCQAHLGQQQEAQQTIARDLMEQPENPETVFVAALVAALGGDEASSLAWTRRALGLGAPPTWFGAPEFAPLRRNPAFLRLFPDGRAPAITRAAGATADD